MDGARALHAAPASGSEGFSLVESLLAMVILGTIVVAIVPFFVNVLQSTNGLGLRQSALSVASARLEYVRSITIANLVTGRYGPDVANLIASPGLVDLSHDDTASSRNSDGTASSGSAAAVIPLTTTQTLNGTPFTLRTYIDTCYLAESDNTCLSSSSNGAPAYRVSVDVSWPRPTGVTCQSGRAGQCEYVTTTLIDPSSDPVFTATPPPTISSIQQVVGGVSSALTTLHPLQQINLKVNGSNYVSGASVTAGSGDVVGALTSNTAMTITSTLQASSATGSRSILVTNPDGKNALSSSYTVSNSSPTITAITPVTAVHGVATTFTLTGTDFYASPSTVPTIYLFTGYGWIAATNVTVTSATSLTFKMTIGGGPYVYPGCYLGLTNPDSQIASTNFTLTMT